MGPAFERLSIPGLVLVRPWRRSDDRGYFVETYTKSVFADAGIRADFTQDNQSLSRLRGTIRGLHFQVAPTPQAKLVRAVAGSMFDVAVDLRRDSATYGAWSGSILTAEHGEQLFIPAGFAHAFCTLEPHTIVAYKVDGAYDRAAERGLRWDDPDIGIDWPVAAADVTLSEKDAALPLLRDAPGPYAFGS